MHGDQEPQTPLENRDNFLFLKMNFELVSKIILKILKNSNKKVLKFSGISKSSQKIKKKIYKNSPEFPRQKFARNRKNS